MQSCLFLEDSMCPCPLLIFAVYKIKSLDFSDSWTSLSHQQFIRKWRLFLGQIPLHHLGSFVGDNASLVETGHARGKPRPTLPHSTTGSLPVITYTLIVLWEVAIIQTFLEQLEASPRDTHLQEVQRHCFTVTRIWWLHCHQEPSPVHSLPTQCPRTEDQKTSGTAC